MSKYDLSKFVRCRQNLASPMIRELRINYIFADDPTWEKLLLACEELGWNKSTIVKQCLHGFFRRDGEFYADAGILDAQSRGMSEEEYFKTLRDGSEDDLTRYSKGRPGFGASPLDAIEPIPTDPAYKRKYNTIGLSAYNFVLLKVARIVDGGAMVQVVSRMIVKHLDDNWETAYQLQIDRDRNCKFK
jgi:hypothetical protein